jgi:hypothetical protein
MLNRRDAMLSLGQIGLAALILQGLLNAETADTARPSAKRRKAKSCIYVILWGGPPQTDLWNMKPGAPQGIRSLFHPISTRVPGIQICDQMPLLANFMDEVTIVRSVTHNSDTVALAR